MKNQKLSEQGISDTTAEKGSGSLFAALISRLKNRQAPTSPASEKADVFYFFGDNPDLDNRISGKGKDNFDEKVLNIKKRLEASETFRIRIGASRYNFYRLHEIAHFCSSLINDETDYSWIRFRIYPLNRLPDRFENYMSEVTSQLPRNIRIEIFDKDLKEMLEKIEQLYLTGRTSEDELVRLLGVLSEYAFIGPRTIVVDPHHKCNTNCSHCWVHTPGIEHTKEFLDMVFPLDRFKKMIDDASQMKVGTIILQGDGEPLLLPQSMEMIKYARQKGIEARFFTNGILLSENIARTVIEIGVSEIYCSFPAGTPETYKKINAMQKPETYNRVVANLKRMMELKKEMGKKNPRIIVTHVIHTQNHHELIKMAQDDAYEGVDAARFYLIRLDHMNKFLQLKDNEVEEIKRQVPIVAKILKEGNVEFVDNIKFQLDNYNQKDGSWSKDVFLKHGCTIGWYFNLIPAKGDISFCCHLRTVGDLSKDSYRDIWNSPDYNVWRRQAKFMSSNLDAVFLNRQKLYDEHCTHCDNHQMLIEIYDTLKRFGLYKYYKDEAE